MKPRPTAKVSKSAWLAAVVVCSVSGAGGDLWSLPIWTANDQPVQGVFEPGTTSSIDTVRIRYQINGGETVDVETSGVVGQGIEFTLRKLAYEAYGVIRVWAEDADTGDPVGNPRMIAIADWREFDISGLTDVELLYPMKSWGMQIRFTPCCLINGGYLRVERIPINPAKSGEGLPETLASDFLHLAPDPTVVATAGLNAEIEIAPESALADSPKDVTVYEWFKGRWSPVIGAELHQETNTIRFGALEGGFFVLASKPGLQR